MADLNSPVDPLFVDELSDCARRAGCDIAPVLAAVRPEGGALTLRQYGEVWFRLAQEMGDEMLGTTPAPLRPGGFALMCHTILGAPDPGRALRRALWFMQVVTGLPEAELTTRNGQATLTFAAKVSLSGAPLPGGPMSGAPMSSAFACRTLLIVLLGPLCWLARRPIPLTEVHFPGPPPARERAYARLFGTPVSFGAPMLKISFAAAPLTLPITRNEAALKRYLKQAPANLLVGYHGSDDLTGQIRAILTALPSRDWPDFAALAPEFGMSASTLRRQLRAEGSSFREITAALQLTRAKRLLREGRLSIAEISDALNYAEPSAFFRAFRIATGTTPARSRREPGSPVTLSDRKQRNPG